MSFVTVVLLSYQTGCCQSQTDQFQIACPQRVVVGTKKTTADDRSTMTALIIKRSLKSDGCFFSCTIEFFQAIDLKHSLGYSYHVKLGRNCF